MVLTASAGFLGGATFMVLVMIWFFRNQMVQTFDSEYDFEETVKRAEAAIKDSKWGIPGQHDVNAMTAKKGVHVKNRVHIIELCKPEYAKQVLEDQPHFAAMMPCRFGIFEENGKVKISKLNTGMMSKFLSGSVKTMMGKVGKEEHAIVQSM